MMPFHLPLDYDSHSLHQVNVMHLMPAGLSRISFNIEPLHAGLISALLRLAWSWHIHTLPQVLGKGTKLMHLSNVLSMPRATIICCFCSLLNSSFWGS